MRGLLRLASLLVPAGRREDWLAEWRAELEHARLSGERRGEAPQLTRLRLAARALGAVPDALWLRRGGGGSGCWRRALRDATRSLVRRPGFSLAVIGTLALGMGSATAIFTVVDALMLRPLPFHEPDRLVAVHDPRGGLAVDAEALREWRSQERVFADVRAHAGRSFILTGAGEARDYRAELVEPGFLELLGVRPLLGRGFTPEEAMPGSHRVVLLSHDVWNEAFGKDPGVVGRTVELDGEPHTVVGVLPPTLRVVPGGIVHLLVPLTDPPPWDRLAALARLRPGLPLDAAQARLDQVSDVLGRERPRERGWEVTLSPLERFAALRDRERAGFLALAGGVACLLLIACANAAGLLFLRGVARRPELALRVALGSSRGALALHVLAEGVVLALVAGVVGTAAAWVGVQGLVALLPSTLVRFSFTTVTMDGRVWAFAFGLTLLTGLAAGTLPAWRAARSIVARTGRAATAGRHEIRVRSALQVLQLALAVMLLAGAGLFGTSFHRLTSVPVGYEPDRVLELRLVSLERLRGDPEATAARARELDERLRALPGVRGVSRATGMGLRFDYTLEPEDGEARPSGSEILPHLSVDTAYFGVMGIPIVEGRGFEAEDALPGVENVVIDRDLAASLWPGRSAVGRRFRVGEEPWMTVVGVTGDVKLEGPHDPYGPLLMFYPADAAQLRSGKVLIRTAGKPEALMAAVREAVRSVDPDQPIRSLETGRQALGDTVADPRLLVVIMGVFAAVAVTLAAVGVYGLVSFTVAQRSREIGLRMALGARGWRVVGEVVAGGLGLGALGVAVGLAGAGALSRLVASLLFGTSPLDPLALAGAAVVLLACCAAALVLPARRAAAVDPAETLRAE